MLFVIAGTSGVGKSHLEQELTQNYGFNQPNKYTDRALRPSEIQGQGIVCIPTENYMAMRSGFFFELEYRGQHYGWKNADLATNKPNVIAVTLEAMERSFDEIKLPFVPVLLSVNKDKLPLLRMRMEKRQITDGMNDIERQAALDDISKRMDLAETECEYAQKLVGHVQKARGGIFFIEDDTTLYKSVIPFILDKTKHA